MAYEITYYPPVSPILIGGLMLAASHIRRPYRPFNLNWEKSPALDSANRKIEEARQKRLKEKEMRRMKRENG